MKPLFFFSDLVHQQIPGGNPPPFGFQTSVLSFQKAAIVTAKMLPVLTWELTSAAVTWTWEMGKTGDVK